MQGVSSIGGTDSALPPEPDESLRVLIDIVIAASQTAALIPDAGTHHIPGILQFPNGCANSVHALLIDGGKPFEGIIPVVRQESICESRPLGFQRQNFYCEDDDCS